MSCRVSRAKRAIQIRKEPHLYQICEGCESILTRSVATCPRCHSYRFDTDPETIRSAAIRLVEKS